VPFTVKALDAQGNVVADAPMRVGGPRGAVWVEDGELRGSAPARTRSPPARLARGGARRR
jgi:hypothetical protein